MSIVYHTDKRSGITYAYESKSYWYSEKKQSRSKRTLIGRVDPDTGEIRKTDGKIRQYHLVSANQSIWRSGNTQ